MLLNRRHALVATTGLALGSFGSGVLRAKEQQDDVRTGAAGVPDVAELAKECSAACTTALAVNRQCPGFEDEAWIEAMSLCRDCSDICVVTAAVLARKGAMAPALCQACADACSRLQATCQQFFTIPEIRACGAVAGHCATACCHSIHFPT